MLCSFGRFLSTSSWELWSHKQNSTMAVMLVRHSQSFAFREGRVVEDQNTVNTSQKNRITIPLRLEKRLDKKEMLDNTKYMKRKHMIQASRKGSTRVVISAKQSNLNHYLGQSYGAEDELPLVSNGWTHRLAASANDYFKIHAHSTNYALADNDDETTFKDLGLKSNIVELLEKKLIVKPTWVQKLAIPKLLAGLNCLVSSETGSGKTLAYLLPMFENILYRKKLRSYNSNSFNEPLALILVPSRELADQVFQVAESLGTELGINVKLIQGGNLGSKIKNPPTENIDIIVSTVNAINQLTKTEVYTTKKVGFVILDEADTLLDDSFIDDVVDYLRRFPFMGNQEEVKVQIGLVSATLPQMLDSRFEELLPPDSLVNVTTPGLHMIMKHVPQKFLRLRKSDKPLKIIELLQQDRKSNYSTIVFCNKHDTCQWLSPYLKKNGIENILLTSGISPSIRKGRLEAYLQGEVKVLVCTDIGSRGIDTRQTSHVINYDFPSYIADYVHRCGRTGRVGSTVAGKVTNFISWRSEVKLVQSIECSVRKETSLRRMDANIKKLLNMKYNYGMGKQIIGDAE